MKVSDLYSSKDDVTVVSSAETMKQTNVSPGWKKIKMNVEGLTDNENQFLEEIFKIACGRGCEIVLIACLDTIQREKNDSFHVGFTVDCFTNLISWCQVWNRIMLPIRLNRLLSKMEKKQVQEVMHCFTMYTNNDHAVSKIGSKRIYLHSKDIGRHQESLSSMRTTTTTKRGLGSNTKITYQEISEEKDSSSTYDVELECTEKWSTREEV
mmetsp:Transcript_18933/g.21704  ORF Transcript_18933/g.21704 Transcript_18933/m.21704 type:complete len:210 (+) Transcript_18933:74-703(+)